MGRPHFAIVAGVCASAASFFGKCISFVDENDNLANDDKSSSADHDQSSVLNTFIQNWLLKIICIALMVISNMLVWTFFVKSLHQQGGSVVATVTSTATNYCCSAAIGGIVFGERTTPLWWFGTLLVMIGLRFISIDAESAEIKTSQEIIADSVGDSSINAKKDK